MTDREGRVLQGEGHAHPWGGTAATVGGEQGPSGGPRTGPRKTSCCSPLLWDGQPQTLAHQLPPC